MNKLTLLFFGLLTLASNTVLRAQSTPFVYDTVVRTIDIYDRAGGYARSLSMGAGGFGMINSGGQTIQRAAVGIQTYIANPFLVDPFDVIVNPAWVSHYRGIATIDVAPEFAGFNFGVTPDFSMGLMLSKKSFPGLTTVSPQDSSLSKVSYPLSSVTGLDNTMYLFGAMAFSGTSIGLGVSYTSAGYDNTGAVNTQQTTNESLSQLGINAGVLAAIGSDAKLDAALTLMFPSYSYSATVGSPNSSATFTSSKTIIGFNARAMLNTSSNLIWIPMADFYTISGSTHTTSGPTPAVDTTTSAPSRSSIDVGFGANYILGDLLLVGGLSLGDYSETYTGSGGGPDHHTSQFIFPRWNLGAEYRIEKLLKLRIGYAVSNGTQNSPGALSPDSKSIGTISQTIRDNYFSPSLSQDAGLSAGVGFVYEKFFLDISVTNIEASSPTFAAQIGFVFGAPPKP